MLVYKGDFESLDRILLVSCLLFSTFLSSDSYSIQAFDVVGLPMEDTNIFSNLIFLSPNYL